MQAVRNSVPGLKGRALSGPHDYEQIPTLAERSVLRIQNFYADMEERLALTPYIAGEIFSVADITALVAVDFAAGGVKLPIPDDRPALKRWYESVSSRSSASA